MKMLIESLTGLSVLVIVTIIYTRYVEGNTFAYKDIVYTVYYGDYEWSRARVVCFREGGDIIEIKDTATQNEVMLALGSQVIEADGFWIGAMRLQENEADGWLWTSETQVEYFNWYNSTKETQQGECVLMQANDFKWRSYPCNDVRYQFSFICSNTSSNPYISSVTPNTNLTAFYTGQYFTIDVELTIPPKRTWETPVIHMFNWFDSDDATELYLLMPTLEIGTNLNCIKFNELIDGAFFCGCGMKNRNGNVDNNIIRVRYGVLIMKAPESVLRIGTANYIHSTHHPINRIVNFPLVFHYISKPKNWLPLSKSRSKLNHLGNRAKVPLPNINLISMGKIYVQPDNKITIHKILLSNTKIAQLGRGNISVKMMPFSKNPLLAIPVSITESKNSVKGKTLIFSINAYIPYVSSTVIVDVSTSHESNNSVLGISWLKLDQVGWNYNESERIPLHFENIARGCDLDNSLSLYLGKMSNRGLYLLPNTTENDLVRFKVCVYFKEQPSEGLTYPLKVRISFEYPHTIPALEGSIGIETTNVFEYDNAEMVANLSQESSFDINSNDTLMTIMVETVLNTVYSYYILLFMDINVNTVHTVQFENVTITNAQRNLDCVRVNMYEIELRENTEETERRELAVIQLNASNVFDVSDDENTVTLKMLVKSEPQNIQISVASITLETYLSLISNTSTSLDVSDESCENKSNTIERDVFLHLVVCVLQYLLAIQ